VGADTRRRHETKYLFFPPSLQSWEACTCAAWQHSILFYTHTHPKFFSFSSAAAAVYLSDLLLERQWFIYRFKPSKLLFPETFLQLSFILSSRIFFFLSARARRVCVEKINLLIFKDNVYLKAARTARWIFSRSRRLLFLKCKFQLETRSECGARVNASAHPECNYSEQDMQPARLAH
jgi:hypothetical protein